MMKNNAVLLTILFALVISLASVTVVFLEFYKLNKKQYIDHIFTKYSVITQIYQAHHLRESSTILLEANLAIYKLFIVKNSEKQNEILSSAKMLKNETFQNVDTSMIFNNQSFYTQQKTRTLKISMLEFDNNIYFSIQTFAHILLIKDNELQPYNYGNILYTYLTVVITIILSFLLILQKLRPLIRLRKKIAAYGAGNMDISFKTSSVDEIGAIANELEKARQRINNMLEARTLFLRNLMHELKTPIAKGMIASQMLTSQKQKDRFVSIFTRLESLIEEFALIEEVTSLGDQNHFQEYRLIDIIDGAIDMAMVEKEHVDVEVPSHIKIYANYRFYTTAIKNMIDNAMKYSPDKHITIVMRNGELCFESKGECLAKPLQYYIEPFTKENPSKNSFGLGLYLVDSILKVHKQVLAHEYENGINRFIFAHE